MSFTLRASCALMAGAASLALLPQFTVAREVGDPAQVSPAGDDDAGAGNRPIVVTGTRIKGGEVAGEVITLSRGSITEAGQIDLGEAARALPQNYGGGQNPGVGTGAGLVNGNVNSASSVNLRGLGPDATLTLLNGHRLPYDAAFGGVDIAAIPVAAIERIEVVPDGASALYGSDAVAGVVNVILRRDYDGVSTSAQLGASTDGGYVRQQADVVAGHRWATGGLMVAYDYAHNSAISASQRDYASSLDPLTSLYPEVRRHAVTATLHQELAPGIMFSLDGLYAKRTSLTIGGTATARYRFAPEVNSFTLAPSLEVALGSDWTLRILGVYGRDRTHYATTFTPAGGAPSLTAGCFCNRAASVEAGVEGPLFALPGGAARVALGAGTRSNGMTYTRVVGGTLSGGFDVTRTSRFAYGEINLPFVGPETGMAGVERLSLSGALRYEDYPGMARLTTPRLGLVYAPVAGLTLRGTWSRSFKAPTLFQQYTPYQAYLLPAAAFGAGGAGTTVAYASGGNPNLKPEHARSWTAGFELRPTSGVTLSATWFDIRYKDRVVQPIAGSIAAAFSDPGYATLINRSPSPSALADLIAGAQFGLQNFSGSTYNPASVVALVDNRNVNVAFQAIHGVDARAAWTGELGSGRSLSLDLDGTWLESDQQLTSVLPKVQLAGSVFNPPRVRVRGTAAYRDERFTAASTLNYVGALADKRFATPARIAPSATLDLALRYVLIAGEGAVGASEPGLALSLVVNNVLNDKPDLIRTTGPTDTPYDSTNYSPIGRFVAVGLTRRW